MSDEPLDPEDEALVDAHNDGFSAGYAACMQDLYSVIKRLREESESIKDDTRYNGYNSALEDISTKMGV